MKQKDKTKFRASAKWKKFRLFVKALYGGRDYITGSKLYKGWNCHHMDLSPDHYEDLSNPDNFIPLNKQTHETLHWLYRYYHKDPAILDRLKEVLDKMATINNV